jgi:hypothetical protein
MKVAKNGRYLARVNISVTETNFSSYTVDDILRNVRADL